MKKYLFLFSTITVSLYAMEQPTEQWWKDVEFDETVFTHKIDEPSLEIAPDVPSDTSSASFYELRQKPDLNQELFYYAICPSCHHKKTHWLQPTIEADMKNHVKGCDPKKMDAILIQNDFSRFYTITTHCSVPQDSNPCYYNAERKNVRLIEGFNARSLLLHHIQNIHTQWLHEQTNEKLENTLDTFIQCIDTTSNPPLESEEQEPLITYSLPEDKAGQIIMNQKLRQEPQEAFYHWACDHPDCATTITHLTPKIGTKIIEHYKTNHHKNISSKICKKMLTKIQSPSQQYNFTIPCPCTNTKITNNPKKRSFIDSNNNCIYAHHKIDNLQYLIKLREILLQHIKTSHADQIYTRSNLDIYIYDQLKKSEETSTEMNKKRKIIK